jgi:sodium/hydrogen exchanger 10/11
VIEGESLLNDGVAILLYEIFIGFVENDYQPKSERGENSAGDITENVIRKFCQIALGGPVFGWVIAKITIYLLGYVFNDPPVEISATIVAAYLTYYISEDILSTVLRLSLLTKKSRG